MAENQRNHVIMPKADTIYKANITSIQGIQLSTISALKQTRLTGILNPAGLVCERISVSFEPVKRYWHKGAVRSRKRLARLNSRLDTRKKSFGVSKMACHKCQKGGPSIIQCLVKKWYAQCTNCGWSTPHFPSAGEAMEFWNRRNENAGKSED